MRRILAAVSILFAAAPAFAQCSDADKKALEAFDHAWGDATTRGDRAALQAIMADEYQGLGPAATQGKAAAIDAAVQAAERNRANPPRPRGSPTTRTRSPAPRYGDDNPSHHRDREGRRERSDLPEPQRSRSRGKAMDRRVRFTDVYIKRDGRWQVWATQGTTIP